MNRFFNPIYLVLLVICGFTSCSSDEDFAPSRVKPSRSLVVLFESDVHCAVDEYSKLAGLRDAIADTADVVLVSSGDFMSGGSIGNISKGKYIIDLMNRVGYEAVTLGNHEFDYGVPHLLELSPSMKMSIVDANLFDMQGNRLFPSYKVSKVGNKKIGFVGVTTPESMTSESYSFFDNEGNQLYDISNELTVSSVQAAVDQCRKEGADYVIVLSHLGSEKNAYDDIISNELIAQTKGIDVLLDGHVHAVIPEVLVKNAEGKDVIVSEPGTQLNNIGKLLIKDGVMHTSIIPNRQLTHINKDVKDLADSITNVLSPILNEKLGYSAYELAISENGVRTSRFKECVMGDFVADAYRTVMQTELGLLNGGAIRNEIKAGDILFCDLFNAFPFDNYACRTTISGAKLEMLLNAYTQITPMENGNFPQVSGFRFTINTGMTPTVSDLEILDTVTGKYNPVAPQRIYSIALIDFLNDSALGKKILTDSKESGKRVHTRDCIREYLVNILNGKVGDEYAAPQGRIIIK